MRIVYIVQYFRLPTESGSSRSFEQAKRMAQAGHDVHVVSSQLENSDTAAWRETHVSGITVHQYPVPYSNTMTVPERIAAFAKFALVSTIKARQLRGDLVFSSSTPLTTAIPGLLASHAPRRPFVFEVRDLWPDLPIAFGALKSPVTRSAARLLERLAYRQAAHIVALSPDMKKRIVELSPRGKQVTVIPNASDVELFDVPADRVAQWLAENPRLPADRPLAVYVGTLGKANRVDFLVDVATELRNIGSRIAVVVVGAGNGKEEVVSAAKRSGGLDNNFFLFDRVPKNVVPLIYGAASVVLSCLAPMKALESSSPNKVFDAFAAGKPVAINYGGWVAKTLEESEAGFSAPYDPAKFAKKLDEMVESKGCLRRASAASKKLGLETFNRNKLVSHLVRVLEQTATSTTVEPSRNTVTT